ncbi:MAG: KH domain-containing protein [Ardenticatenaceae bacterium]|nr:KH domain-containing protein [Anaerolineales bacterium]MCB8937486.1 KH domain-containing protein [Ardenticatenaceae bacterium]MCB8975533.1 KH domain-containing protein [Ardenticatenaceae bacterium]
MKDLVEYVVKSLVEAPDDVSIEEFEEDGETVLEITVAGPDMGRVIGKSGRVINAIRTLAQVAAAKQGTRVAVELVETGDR